MVRRGLNSHHRWTSQGLQKRPKTFQTTRGTVTADEPDEEKKKGII